MSSPKISVWSSPMLVIIEISGFIILTASSLPPSPTSNIITSKFDLLKIIKAAKVLNSKYVSVILPLVSSIDSNASHIEFVFTGTLSILIRSLKFNRCGDVYEPTL